jgi:hypothetical protein
MSLKGIQQIGWRQRKLKNTNSKQADDDLAVSVISHNQSTMTE